MLVLQLALRALKLLQPPSNHHNASAWGRARSDVSVAGPKSGPMASLRRTVADEVLGDLAPYATVSARHKGHFALEGVALEDGGLGERVRRGRGARDELHHERGPSTSRPSDY